MKIDYFNKDAKAPVTLSKPLFLLMGGSLLAQVKQLPADKQKRIMDAFKIWLQEKGITIQNQNDLEQAFDQFYQEKQQASAAPQTQMAKNGVKLNYLRKLRGKCPEGEEMVYMKNGGCLCQKKKDGGEAKADKKQFFGKDKKVSKAAAGIRFNVYPDSVTVHDRRDINGNGTYTETFPNDSVSTTVYGKDVQGFSAPYGNPTITKNKAGKVLVRAGSNLPLSEGRLLHGTDSTFISNKANDINNSKSLQTDTIFKLPIVFTHKNGGELDKSENKKFFKREKKAPLAKCGMKSKKKL